jgi:hypothetical protein
MPPQGLAPDLKALRGDVGFLPIQMFLERLDGLRPGGAAAFKTLSHSSKMMGISSMTSPKVGFVPG